MNFKHIGIVFKKEMKDAFRDKKSVLSNIFLPLVLIPLIYYCMNFFIKSTNKEVEENMKISIVSTDNGVEANQFTKENIIGGDKIEIVSNTYEQAKAALKNGDINCIITYEEAFFANLDKGIMSNIKLEYNSQKSASQIGAEMLKSKIMVLNQKLATEKLAQMNVSPEILNLVNITGNDVSLEDNADGAARNDMLIMIIPMYLVIVIVTAGVPIAIDVLAGERERNTFEALLSTKANRLSILIGKYMAILVFSIIAIIMSFIGLLLGIVMNPEMFSNGTQEVTMAAIFSTMNMGVGPLLLALLSAITLAIAFAGIQIGISTWAKSVKEAQTYLSYMMFPAMILGFATMFMGVGDMQPFMAYIPIFNTIASLKMVLSGVTNYGFLITGVIVNIVFVCIITFFIIKMFKKEKTVIR
ncbi:MAG: ABC transporter permease [Clostridia bacterium]|nr:ABC transporter permease [Clostridia bacterium]